MKPLANKEEAKAIALRCGLPAGPLSFSQISTWLMCHRSYWHSYVNHTPREWSENLILGAAMHSGLEFVNKQRMAGSTIQVDGALRAMNTTLLHELSKLEVSSDDNAKLRKQMKMLGELLNLWIRDYIAGFRPTGVEETLYVQLGGTPMVVKIDMIDNNRKVSDFKLTRKFKGESQVKDSLQLSIYAAATKIQTTSFISLKFPDLSLKSWKPSIDEVVVRKKVEDLEWSEEVVASVSKGIILEDWSICDPGEWKCSPKYCDYWNRCRGRNKTKKPGWMQSALRIPGAV